MNAEQIIKENPSRVPIIIRSERKTMKLNKKEYLVPKRLKVIHFIATLRKSINLDSENAIYLYVNNKLLKPDKFIAEVYEEHKSED
jgi:GABA(A) receptor-associated protein